MSFYYTSKLLCNHIILSIRNAIQKLGWDVTSIVLKFPNDQTISLKIINEKQGNAPVEYIVELFRNWNKFHQHANQFVINNMDFEAINCYQKYLKKN